MGENLSSGLRVVKNYLYLLSGNIIAQFLGFLSIVYLARVLKADGFGKVAFAQGILAYFLLLSDLGLKTFGTIEVARDRSGLKGHVDNIVTMRALLSAIAFILLILMVLLIDKPLEQKYLIVLFGVSIFPSAILLDWFFQGTERMVLIGITNVLRSATYITLLLIFLKERDLLYVPLYFLAATVLATFPILIEFINKHGWIRPSFELSVWKNSIVRAVPIGLSNIMIQIYYNIDTVMLGFMKSEKDVGLYNAAYKIVLFLLGFASIMGMVFLPNITKIYSESKYNTERLLRYLSKATILCGIPVVIGGMLISRGIINFFYGGEYNGSILPLQILIWSVFTVFSNIPFALILFASEKEKDYLHSVTAGAAINIALNIILIPMYSLVGAGIATMISEFTVLTLLYLYARRLFQIPILKNMILGFVASLIMAGGLLLVRDKINLFISIMFGALVYILSLIILKVINKEDITFIREGLKVKSF